MSEPIKVQVKIAGKTYHLISTESEEYLHKVAELVNGKIAEIEQRNHFLGTDVKMVLTALNLAEDYIKLQQKTEQLQQRDGTQKKNATASAMNKKEEKQPENVNAENQKKKENGNR